MFVVVAVLALSLFAVQVTAQAPGDEQNVPCNSVRTLVHTYSDDWHLLMDSFNYQYLLVAPMQQSVRAVWKTQDFDGTGFGVRMH